MKEIITRFRKQRRWFRPFDGIVALAVMSVVGVTAIILSPAIVLTRAVWRRRARRRGGLRPRSLLTISYTTFDEASAKGIMDDPNLWYNCGETFEKVLVYVALAETAGQRQVTDRVQYRQDGCIFPNWQIPFAWTLLLLRYLRGWWRASLFALDADVMLVNGPNRSAQVGIVPRVIMGIPALVFIEAFWEEILPQQPYVHARLRWAVLLWYRIVYRAFDAYCGTASFAAPGYAKLGMNVERIFPYVNNVDVMALSAAAAQARIPRELENRPRPWIVTVGRLHIEKKPKSAIELQVRLAERGVLGTGILVGDGEARAELQRLSNDLGMHDRLVFLGQLSQPEGMAVAAASDYYFAPMQGNAMIEAMAAGCCIVAYDNDAHRIYVEDNRTAHH
jgi:glycosyltransferase involved in cell wall biosynthesis